VIPAQSPPSSQNDQTTNPQTYLLTIAINGQGSTFPSSGSYNIAKDQSITIFTQAAGGWKFDGWTGDASGITPFITLTMNGNEDITANFARIALFTLPSYSLTTAVSGNGTVTPAPGVHTYVTGTVVYLIAVPDNQWKFDGWSGDISENTYSTSVTMDRDLAVTANFSIIPLIPLITFTLTLSVNGPGVIEPGVGKHSYDIGSVVNISATPDPGSQFDGWSGNVASPTSATTTLTINKDNTVTANFSKTPISYGPENRHIGAGYGIWPISMKPGDRVEFSFSVTNGDDVIYSVIGPNKNPIISSSPLSAGQNTFTATTAGDYQLKIASSGTLNLTAVSVTYTIYPVP
jgi:hypothetical protein